MVLAMIIWAVFVAVDYIIWNVIHASFNWQPSDDLGRQEPCPVQAVRRARTAQAPNQLLES